MDTSVLIFLIVVIAFIVFIFIRNNRKSKSNSQKFRDAASRGDKKFFSEKLEGQNPKVLPHLIRQMAEALPPISPEKVSRVLNKAIEDRIIVRRCRDGAKFKGSLSRLLVLGYSKNFFVGRKDRAKLLIVFHKAEVPYLEDGVLTIRFFNGNWETVLGYVDLEVFSYDGQLWYKLGYKEELLEGGFDGEEISELKKLLHSLTKPEPPGHELGFTHVSTKQFMLDSERVRLLSEDAILINGFHAEEYLEASGTARCPVCAGNVQFQLVHLEIGGVSFSESSCPDCASTISLTCEAMKHTDGTILLFEGEPLVTSRPVKPGAKVTKISIDQVIAHTR